jgi:ABC-2 type transport system ATP-binding protein/ribosome-dependent ATPase
MSSLVEMTGVSRRFGEILAVDRVDLTIGRGTVIGLIGANGAGKTTVMRMLLGLLRPSGGSVLLFGAPPSRATRSRIGYVPQNIGLYRDLTVAENMDFIVMAFGLRPPTLEDDLVEVRDTLVSDVSLGVQRRVAFSAALAHSPELLVLDEPTSGISALARARLWERIRAAAEAGAGVLVSTHSMDEADQCDDVVVMSKGAVVARGSVRDIIGSSRSVEVDASEWERAFATLEAAGLEPALVGTHLRLREESRQRAESALAAEGVTATVTAVAATFEEIFVALTS